MTFSFFIFIKTKAICNHRDEIYFLNDSFATPAFAGWLNQTFNIQFIRAHTTLLSMTVRIIGSA
jgi:hypothetical protein